MNEIFGDVNLKFKIKRYVYAVAVFLGGRCSHIEVDTRRLKKRTVIKHINVSFMRSILHFYII